MSSSNFEQIDLDPRLTRESFLRKNHDIGGNANDDCNDEYNDDYNYDDQNKG